MPLLTGWHYSFYKVTKVHKSVGVGSEVCLIAKDNVNANVNHQTFGRKYLKA